MKKITSIGLLGAIALSGSAYADVNVGGFVDAGYRWTKDATPSSSWGVNDGAVHLTGNSGSTGYLVDLGFSATNTWADQAFVTNKYDSGFNWRVGMFDSILGHENQDSNTYSFSNQSHIGSWFSSFHTGALLGYDLSDMLSLSVLVANGTTGNNGNNTSGNTDGFAYPQFGFRLDSKSDGMGFWVAGIFESEGGESGYTFDLGATSEMGGMDLGLELAMMKPAVANADSGMIVSVDVAKDVSETMGFGARFEWDNGKTRTGTDPGEAAMFFDVGPNFQLSENSTAYLDYNLAKYKNSSTHSVGLALRHNF